MSKKKTAVLCVLLAISLTGQWMVRKSMAQATNALSGPEVSKEKGNSGNLFADESSDSEEENLTLELIRQLVVMLLVVVLIGSGLWWVARKFNTGFAGTKARQIHVAETVSLGPRKLIHVVQIGSKKMLLGSTPENVRFLADVTDSYSDVSQRETGSK